MMLLKCFSRSFIIIIIVIHFLHQTCLGYKYCDPSACGNIRNISFPFRLRNDPKKCGIPNYELSCQKNTTYLFIDSHKYIVQAINYHNYTIRLTYPSIKINDTCSFPEYSPSPNSLTGFPYSTKAYTTGWKQWNDWPDIARSITLMSGPTYAMNNNSLLLETTSAHCFNESNRRRRTYIKFGLLNGSYIMDMCRIEFMAMTSLPIKDEKRVSLSETHSSLLYGFELSWMSMPFISWLFAEIKKWKMMIILLSVIGILFGFSIALKILIGVPCLLGLLIYIHRTRRHLSMFEVIEGFLRSNNNLMPIRYSYSNIKKMTKGFRKKLGEGGYGSVYKGQLRSGHDVAIKLLNKPRANGQDFINEVATIGRIHHVNVVKLVGYCAESSKCALVYDFMPNGSLEKYTFSHEQTSNPLSWEKKYHIALGVAHGIEYLHKGCDVQILHFDIKPHNILLDDNFTPKISDFGLAKFYSTENATVTLTAARGTIGYVAPELINRSIGEVSYKADVYSFGMLLMEMVGVKREMVADDDKSSQYFPNWIYDRFNNGKDIEIGNVEENDNDIELARKIARKITIVGLWCIQMSPGDRPTMGEVVRMLERENEDLQIPPQPSESQQINMLNNSQTWETESIDSIGFANP